MPAPERKRVFILGAGFSKAAGMPDACGLTDLLLNAKFIRDNEGLQAWVASLRKRISVLHAEPETSGAVSVNVEQLFDYAAFDRELWLMRQHGCSTMFGPATPLAHANTIGSWLYMMEYFLVGVLIQAQEGANSSSLPTLANWLRNGDTVMTFNYDTLLECALTACGRTWSHGFQAEKSGDVTVLKLHGSIDWWLAPRERLSDLTLILVDIGNSATNWNRALEDPTNMPWEDRFVLTRVDTLEKAKGYYRQHTGLSPGTAPWPGLGGLGVHKPLHRLIGSGLVWVNALTELKEADEIYVIGWSASPYDTMARFHFASVLALRESQPSRVVVVDPNVCKQIANYKAIFKDVEPIGQCAERVDWDSLLGR